MKSTSKSISAIHPIRRTSKNNLRRALLEAVEPRRLMAAFDANFGGDSASEFDSGGVVFNSLSTLPQADGSILTVAAVPDTFGDVQVRRFNSNGTLDTNFGIDGVATVSLGTAGLTASVKSVVGASDGSIYIAGELDQSDEQFDPAYVAHIHADGSFDSTFSGSGLKVLPALFTGTPSTSSSAFAPTLAVAPVTGEVYVGYTYDSAEDSTAVVIKMNANGDAPAGGFGSDGAVSLSIPGAEGSLEKIVLRGSSLLLVGDTFKTVTDDGTNLDASLFTAVLSSNGTLTPAGDPGTDGLADNFGLTTIDGLDAYDVDGVAIDANGNLIVAGMRSSRFTTDASPVFVKLNSSYAADSAFGTNGVVTLSDDRNITVESDLNDHLHVDAGGNVYGLGTQQADDGSQSLALIGLTRNGAIRGDFGNAGVLFYNPSTQAEGGVAASYSIAAAAGNSAIVTGVAMSNDLPLSGVLLKLTGDVAPNTPPSVIAVAGPVTEIQTGQSVSFTATFVDADFGDQLTVSWDFGDGQTQAAAVGTQPTASASHVYTAIGTFLVTFTVTDAAGASATGTTQITVVPPPPVNHAPTVTSVTGPAGSTQTNTPATFTAIFGDQDSSDSLQVAWNFGDGATLAFAPASAPTASAVHAYAAPGTYTVTFTVRDAAGATATGTTTITIINPPTPTVPYTLVNGKLALTGTSGNDTAAVTKNGSGQTVLTYNGTSYVVPGAVTSILIDGAAGNDTIRVSTQFSIPTTLVGGAGNDTVRGGNGADVLIGDAGNDTLIGRNGRDLLVGGVGADLLISNEQDDILISGTTSYASNDYASYSAIMAEWTSGRSYILRVANLVIPISILPHANGGTYLTPGLNVFNDSSVDTVVGGTGNDLPFVTIVGSNRDVVNDGQTNFASSILALINGD